MDTGVGKVFIPSDDQMLGKSGGFSWFDSNFKRIANYNGAATEYWTATPRDSSGVHDSSNVWIVDSYGGIYNYDGASHSNGFCPCICIKYK